MPQVPAAMSIPSVIETAEQKALMIKNVIFTHLASLESSTASVLKSFVLEGAALPAELAALEAMIMPVLPELKAVATDFFILLQMVQQITTIKAIDPQKPA